LLLIRSTLEILHKKHCPIILQDPEYTDEDQKAANAEGMTIVNANFGYEEGWLKLDESTLVVDHITDFPILDLIFEITRPAAIFSLKPYKDEPQDDWKYAPFSFTLLDDRIPPNEVQVLGLGIKNRSDKRQGILRGE
jgi:hypothetical protein